jgi:predicted transcriptional regulator
MKTATGYIKISETVTVPNDEANGSLIRILRTKANMSLRELARQLDVSAPYVSDLELGRRSFSENLFRRAKEAIAKHNGKAA